MEKIIIIYFVAVNLIGLAAMGMDKSRAKRHAWRIPERTLFFISILGGSLGSWAGMYLFHHKTKHWYFVTGMPLILIVQTALAFFLYAKL